ncbi:SMP-30/gluconolactonase/LRE family protein [Actinokineospora sp. UTMC 2448]|uniref:SMP-30/gluconolactonase/LRE family protein n=1 Tax=Actinokineospora sp. UTMC 2448 TaxID=2268449 RepID=UPI0021644C07|nr:SMP-30/gluconolactonase/LRE family protein [Actinokineospora sp. UTMC 2448]UVS81627.1 Gluconolactonase [Actinokineospora sp. UTMC 2448]
MTTTARSLAGPARAPVWCGLELCWLDQPAERLRVGRVAAGAVRQVAAYALDDRPLSALPCRTGWLVATPSRVVHLRRDGRQSPTPWPAADLLTCDPGGRLWLATPDALLRADLSGRLRVAATGPTLALTWHPSATTLYRATPTGIDAHPYDLANGLLGAPTHLSDDVATALAVDHTGQLWAAVPNGVRCVGPTCLTIPITEPTGCCFTTTTLLVTTASGLHPCDTGTGGHPTTRFAE